MNGVAWQKRAGIGQWVAWAVMMLAVLTGCGGSSNTVSFSNASSEMSGTLPTAISALTTTNCGNLLVDVILDGDTSQPLPLKSLACDSNGNYTGTLASTRAIGSHSFALVYYINDPNFSTPVQVGSHASVSATVAAGGSAALNFAQPDTSIDSSGDKITNIEELNLGLDPFTKNTFTLSVAVSGLGATGLVLNNGADALSINSDGTYTFATSLLNTDPYNVTVGTQPTGFVCGVANASGIMGTANVTLSVTCAAGAPPKVTNPIVGAWGNSFDPNNANMLVFYADGNYLIYTTNAQDCPNGSLEYGTYTYDGSNLSVAPANDNGACGFSDSLAPATYPVSLTNNNDQFDLTDPALNQVALSLQRIGDGNPDSIVGGWDIRESANDESFLVFTGNYYITYDSACAAVGVEYGTYTWDGSTLSGNVIRDDNNECGVGAGGTGPFTPVSWSVSSNVSTVTTPQKTYKWDRVGTPGNVPTSHTVTATAGTGGVISPSGTSIVGDGDVIDFTLTPDMKNNYGVATVTGCSGSLANSGTTYSTNPITADCAVTASFAPLGWTWLSGSNTVNASGVYGTQGVAAAANVPGARESAVTWRNAGGHLWLFGGDECGDGCVDNDLWRYDPATNQWTWMSGSNTQNATGVYGTQGRAAAANVPGARSSSVSWKDASGKLWLFGGNGYDSTGTFNYLNDLWRYDPATNQWTWMSGSNTGVAAGVYGTKGVAAAANVPGARYAAVSWIDSDGHLWLFGGYGIDVKGNYNNLNDLWRYDPATNQWTWMSGSNAGAAIGVYGTKGQAAAANGPGARTDAVSWIDASGTLWLFGGNGLDAGGTFGELNDLWRYEPATNQWTWMSGSNTGGAASVYGTQGVAAAANVPGARDSAISWSDTSGHLWLFGGFGLGGGLIALNDLWRYDPTTSQWTWMSGSNTGGATGVYGAQGVTAITNVPGARYHAAAWSDTSGNLWLFGGYVADSFGGLGDINDLWRYFASPSLP